MFRITIIVSLALLAAGCVAGPVPTSAPRSNLVTIEVQPEWKPWLIQHAKEIVLKHLAAPATARFPTEPDILAFFNPSKGMTEFSVVGDVDASNYYGALLRQSYYVNFEQAGRIDADNTFGPRPSGTILGGQVVGP